MCASNVRVRVLLCVRGSCGPHTRARAHIIRLHWLHSSSVALTQTNRFEWPLSLPRFIPASHRNVVYNLSLSTMREQRVSKKRRGAFMRAHSHYQWRGMLPAATRAPNDTRRTLQCRKFIGRTLDALCCCCCVLFLLSLSLMSQCAAAIVKSN